MNQPSKRSLLAGVMITAGCSVGAGMFSLPVVSSGMWFGFSLIVLFSLWGLNYLAALVLLEVNMHFAPGASFDTFVKSILGNVWNIITGLIIAFLLYILLYAYFSAFGNMVLHTFSEHTMITSFFSPGTLSILLGGILGFFVWKSTHVVGQVCTILVFGMAITFICSAFGLSLQVDFSNLLITGESEQSYFKYLWAALPYFLTSFGFSSVVPSLYKYYGNDPVKIQKGLFYGSLIALFVYTLFLFVTFGNVSREEFVAVNRAGGNMGALVTALTNNNNNELTSTALVVFSNCAIISSFLGVGLSLFDYVADRFNFADTPKGRFFSAVITFLPPGIASFFFPNGFIAAIGFAGLILLFGYFFVPLLMVWKIRKKHSVGTFRVKGGNRILLIVFAGAAIVSVSYVLTKLGHLPVY